jgi:hypothetical protein
VDRKNLINSLVDAASTLYRGGMPMPDAVGAALDQYKRHYDEFERSVLYHEVCKQLGGRGGRKTRALGAKKGQLSFHFTAGHKIGTK